MRRNRLNRLVLKSNEHELLCYIDTTSIINKFPSQNPETAIVSIRFATCDNRLRHLYKNYTVSTSDFQLLFAMLHLLTSKILIAL